MRDCMGRYGDFCEILPLPKASPVITGERSTSTNHTSLTLVFLGRFRIRPVSQSASSYGLASWTGQKGDHAKHGGRGEYSGRQG